MHIAYCLLAIGYLKAQSPSAIPYQAVARNNSGNVIASTNISMRFTIHDGTATGTTVYRETQSVTTNALGLFVCNIGQGTPVIGTFNAINWASGNKFTQVEMDVTGGSTYIDMGTSQMLSVPYALYAATSGSGAVGATGATGGAGTNGTNGTAGATGSNGTNGTNGVDGATGIAGTNGTNGLNGATGATGTDGTNGTNGVDGATGADGLVGPTGPAGSGSASVSGTLNYVGKFTPDGTSIGNSQIFDNGSNIGIGVTSAFGGKVSIVESSVATALSSQSNFNNGTGITGIANTGANAWGVFGASTSGYAGYFSGKVQVNGTLETTGNIGINNVPNYPLSFENVVGDKISFFGSAGPHYGIGIQGGIFQLFTPVTGSEIAFGTGQSSSMVTNVTFKGNGRVGIGTTAPQEQLEVTGNVTSSGTLAGFRFADRTMGYNNGYQWYATGGKARFYDHNTNSDRITIDQSGNVGIGTDSPQTLLDVAGTIKTDRFAMITGAGANKVLKSDGFGNANWASEVSMPVGTAPGQMIYWDGSNWITVEPGTTGQTLTYCNGTPHWGSCGNLVLISTSVVTAITTASATCGGTITYDGGTTVTARGICWSTTPYPDITNSHTTDGTGVGTYTSSITGLSTGGYYVRAYASNGAGIAYGNQVFFAASNFLVGQSYQGGNIVYVDATGLHGLIAAPSDQSTSIPWTNGSAFPYLWTDINLGGGNANTNLIVAAQGAGSYAAKLCYDLVLGGYSDWYLPTAYDLKEACRAGVLSSGTNFWSSTEKGMLYGASWGKAAIMGPSNCGQFGYPDYTENYAVRAFRSF